MAEHICLKCAHRTRDGYCGHPTDPQVFLADQDVTGCALFAIPSTPDHTDSPVHVGIREGGKG